MRVKECVHSTLRASQYCGPGAATPLSIAAYCIGGYGSKSHWAGARICKKSKQNSKRKFKIRANIYYPYNKIHIPLSLTGSWVGKRETFKLRTRTKSLQQKNYLLDSLLLVLTMISLILDLDPWPDLQKKSQHSKKIHICLKRKIIGQGLLQALNIRFRYF